MTNHPFETYWNPGVDPDEEETPFLHAPDSGPTKQRANSATTEPRANASSLLKHGNGTDPKEEPVVNIFIRRRGLIYTLGSAVLLSSLTLVAKFLSDSVSANLINFCHGMFLVICSGPILVWKKVSLFNLSKKVWTFLLLRSLSGAASMTCFFYSIQLLDISTAKCLTNLMPVFATVLARVCLKESCTVAKTTFSSLGVLGTFLVVQPSAIFGDTSMRREATTFVPGVLAAIGGAVLYAISVVLLRKLGQVKVNAQLVLLVNGMMITIVGAIMTTILGEWQNISCIGDRFYLITIGYLGYFEIACLTLALQTENAALVTVLRTIDVLLTFILDVIVLHAALNLLTVAGAVFIVTSSVGITVAPHCQKYTKCKNSAK
ncbi:solute carrier family 35 member G1-like [Diadema setosum]|uniref:solute carrier family 35 member G1-like n=1 Tax=Diadema setosum TaxID=31175 RepID=UPI003B3A2D76